LIEDLKKVRKIVGQAIHHPQALIIKSTTV